MRPAPGPLGMVSLYPAIALPRAWGIPFNARSEAAGGTRPMTEGSALIRGLEGVVAAETRLCDLDGRNGRLAYGGYDIDELARQSSFEEVAYLLWHGELPLPAQGKNHCPGTPTAVCRNSTLPSKVAGATCSAGSGATLAATSQAQASDSQ